MSQTSVRHRFFATKRELSPSDLAFLDTLADTSSACAARWTGTNTSTGSARRSTRCVTARTGHQGSRHSCGRGPARYLVRGMPALRGMHRLWLGLVVVLAVSFAVLGFVGSRIYQLAPPIPDRVLSADGSMIFDAGEIAAGQDVWRSFGVMGPMRETIEMPLTLPPELGPAAAVLAELRTRVQAVECGGPYEYTYNCNPHPGTDCIKRQQVTFGLTSCNCERGINDRNCSLPPSRART
jgi:hypothetical protein